MPGMKGTELAAELARTRPETPVLYISGYTDGALAQEQIRENPSIFLAKPFSPPDLVDRVAELVGLPRSPNQGPGDREPGSRARAATEDAAVSNATDRIAAR